MQCLRLQHQTREHLQPTTPGEQKERAAGRQVGGGRQDHQDARDEDHEAAKRLQEVEEGKQQTKQAHPPIAEVSIR